MCVCVCVCVYACMYERREKKETVNKKSLTGRFIKMQTCSFMPKIVALQAPVGSVQVLSEVSI